MNLTALPDGRAARDSQTVADADRRNGQLTSVPNGARASRSVAQRTPAYARQGNSTTAVPMNRVAMDVGRSAEPAADRDHLQAAYFLRLLIPSYRQIDRKIDEHHKAIAIAETRGEPDDADRIRRMLRIDEEERQTLKALIDGLQRRFPVPPGG
jgi:hypothetical protein